MTEEIVAMLDRLDNLKAQLDLLRMDMEAKRRQIIPAEVQAELDALEAEYAPAIEAAQAGIASLEAEIKAAVLEHGATVKASNLQAVWMRGRVTWDTKALDGFAKARPELLAFRKEGPPTVSIRNNR